MVLVTDCKASISPVETTAEIRKLLRLEDESSMKEVKIYHKERKPEEESIVL